MSDFETIIFTCLEDGSITADGFPHRILIARELLELGDDRYLTREGRSVRIRVSNGEAEYRLARRDPAGWPAIVAERVA